MGWGKKQLVYSSTNSNSELDAYKIFDDYSNQLYDSKKMITKYRVVNIDHNQVLLYSQLYELFHGKSYITNYQEGLGRIKEELGRDSKYNYVEVLINTDSNIVTKCKDVDEVYLIPTYVSSDYNNSPFTSSFQVNSKNYTISIQSHLFGEDILRDDTSNQSTTDFEVIAIIHNTIHKNYNNPQRYSDLTSALNGQSDIRVEFKTAPFNYVYDYGRDRTIPVFNDGGAYQIKPNAEIQVDYWNKPSVEVTPNIRFSPSYIVIKGRSGIKLSSNDNIKLTVNGTRLSTTLKELKFKEGEDVVIKLHKHVLWRGRFSNKSLIKSSSNSLSPGGIYIGSSTITSNTNLGNLITNNYVFNPTKLQNNSLQSLQFNLE